MEIKTHSQNIKSFNCLIIGYDVAKYKHNFYCSFEQGSERLETEGEISSSTTKLKIHFQQVKELANKHGFFGVRVVCEPTGGYEKNLMRLARSFGFFTEYVNGEATSKSKVIETNDSGKNDIKDARIIFSLAKQEKTLTCKEEGGIYGHLKLLNSKYEDLSLDLSRLKNSFSSAVDAFFPDLAVTGQQLQSKLCHAVIDRFKLNPYLIAELSFKQFKLKIEKIYSRKIGGQTESLLKKIWNSAQSNSLSIVADWQVEEYEEVISFYHKRIIELKAQKEKYKLKMIAVFKQTKEFQKLEQQPTSDFMLARVVAETGSLENYGVLEKLMKYAGLNLREHSSGTYKGQVRLSKKGNSLLRKVLGQIAFSFFVKTGSIYADYYKEKKTKKGGLYGLTCVMRKVLKMFYGICRSEVNYNEKRVRSQEVIPINSAA